MTTILKCVACGDEKSRGASAFCGCGGEMAEAIVPGEVSDLDEAVIRVEELRHHLLLGEAGEKLPPQAEQFYCRAVASLEAAKCDLKLALYNLRRAT